MPRVWTSLAAPTLGPLYSAYASCSTGAHCALHIPGSPRIIQFATHSVTARLGQLEWTCVSKVFSDLTNQKHSVVSDLLENQLQSRWRNYSQWASCYQNSQEKKAAMHYVRRVEVFQSPLNSICWTMNKNIIECRVWRKSTFCCCQRQKSPRVLMCTRFQQAELTHFSLGVESLPFTNKMDLRSTRPRIFIRAPRNWVKCNILMRYACELFCKWLSLDQARP